MRKVIHTCNQCGADCTEAPISIRVSTLLMPSTSDKPGWNATSSVEDGDFCDFRCLMLFAQERVYCAAPMVER